MRYEAVDDKNVKVFLLNWNNILGTGHTFPNFATVNGKSYSISLYCQAIGDTNEALSHSVLYTVVRGD